MKTLIFIMLIVVGFTAIGQTESSPKVIKNSDSYNIVLSDSAYISATAGDTLNYYMYVQGFAKYSLPSIRLTRTSGDYTKVKGNVYESVDGNTYTLSQTLTFANSSTDTIITGSIDTLYKPYIRYEIAPYDSVQGLRVRIIETIEKQ